MLMGQQLERNSCKVSSLHAKEFEALVYNV